MATNHQCAPARYDSTRHCCCFRPHFAPHCDSMAKSEIRRELQILVRLDGGICATRALFFSSGSCFRALYHCYGNPGFPYVGKCVVVMPHRDAAQTAGDEAPRGGNSCSSCATYCPRFSSLVRAFTSFAICLNFYGHHYGTSSRERVFCSGKGMFRELDSIRARTQGWACIPATSSGQRDRCHALL